MEINIRPTKKTIKVWTVTSFDECFLSYGRNVAEILNYKNMKKKACFSNTLIKKKHLRVTYALFPKKTTCLKFTFSPPIKQSIQNKHQYYFEITKHYHSKIKDCQNLEGTATEYNEYSHPYTRPHVHKEIKYEDQDQD